ncbi:hypothetical protein PNP85_01750 [Halobacterium salinarum]|uniref:Uncharacterized protein n=1 Tax=Halobacterium salinarum (strain ATCC 33171 / DSM 3754 / JCM 8978 / NBRC 102687 / NCIMB 764 / 91-R6) TaxID=2597657 RepID=A0A4D6GW77_HALS9|nr:MULTISPECIES: hypothetical protein [Halobacterium]MCF2165576.1 hypothetical protein [Halobacterium salinarum]MCF2168344.1 hypothetical protein [Halobacterium salinarum]MDL0127949.1 hypothetical protein [Halobacterium salinarum]MDL0138234.1 hypothetical protein [Halobacterium salinarum]QCC44818.1 uncharacterized protein HBSAL_05745 [Halobacterium salinarum]
MVSGGDQDDDDRVLSPDELAIEEQDEVAAIGEDRYVIGPDGPPSAPADGAAEGGAPQREQPPQGDRGGGNTTEQPPEPQITGRDVKEWLAEELDTHDSKYAYHIASKYGDDISHQQLATDDVGAAFDGLLVWYARQLAGSTSIDRALGILLGESSVQVKYPTKRLIAYLEANDLGPDDSIKDLVQTVDDDDGLKFPR